MDNPEYLSSEWFDKVGIVGDENRQEYIHLQLCTETKLAKKAEPLYKRNVGHEYILYIFLFPDPKYNIAAINIENAKKAIIQMNIQRIKNPKDFTYKIEIMDGRDIGSVYSKYYPLVFQTEQQFDSYASEIMEIQEKRTRYLIKKNIRKSQKIKRKPKLNDSYFCKKCQNTIYKAKVEWIDANTNKILKPFKFWCTLPNCSGEVIIKENNKAI